MAVFTARSAASNGISRSTLRSRRFEHLAHGLWTDDELVGVARLGALTQVLPDSAVFCGSSALEILGLPCLGPHVDRPEVLIPAPGHPPQHAGIRSRVASLGDCDVAEVGGLRVLAPRRLFVASAATWAPADLVALGDAMLRRGLVGQDELGAAVAASARRRGVRTARWALPLLDPRSDSVPESRVRLLVVLAGLPRPSCNVDLYDESGRWLGRPDLLFEAYDVGVEYDGEHHYSVEQSRRDVVRNEDIRDGGTDLVVVNALHMRCPQVCLDRIYRRLLAHGLPLLPARPSADPYLAALLRPDQRGYRLLAR